MLFLIVVLLICGCICTLIFKIIRMHTYRLCVYIMCVGGGRVLGGLGRYCYVGVQARERDRCMGVRVF